jgi:hypothetical protein
MEIIRKTVSLDILRSMISIPKDFNYSKVEILILPIEDKAEMETENFNPKMFFGVTNIKDVDKSIQEIRNEWHRI